MISSNKHTNNVENQQVHPKKMKKKFSFYIITRVDKKNVVSRAFGSTLVQDVFAV